MEQKNVYTTIKGEIVTLFIPSVKSFWHDVLWTSIEVDNKIFSSVMIDSMLFILQKVVSDQITEVNDEDIKNNLSKIEDYILKVEDYILMKSVYKHYDLLSQNLVESNNLFVHLGTSNSRNLIEISIINEIYEVVDKISSIQYPQENTSDVIEEMVLQITQNALKNV